MREFITVYILTASISLHSSISSLTMTTFVKFPTKLKKTECNTETEVEKTLVSDQSKGRIKEGIIFQRGPNDN